MRRLVLCLAVPLVACWSPDLNPTPRLCGSGSAVVVADTAVGAIVPGRTAESIYAECTVVSDSLESWEEGIPARIMRVVVGADTVIAVIDKGIVDYVFVEDSSFRTTDSFGVGSRLGDLLRLPGVSATFFEGSFHVASSKHCGVSFRLQPDSLDIDDVKQDWAAADLKKIPGNPAVSAMVVGGCPRLLVQAGQASNAATGIDDGFWKMVNPSSVGMDMSALAAHEALCERTGADACLVVRHDRIVQEWYSPRYSIPIGAMSSTKSVGGLLTGMLIEDKKIPSADERVCTFISAWCEGIRGRVTLRHLLSMTAGLPEMPDSSVGYVEDKNAYVIRLQPTSEPGTKWAYSNETSQLLSPILDRAAGEPIQDYARRRLFEPLGMTSTRLHVYPKNAWLYAEMETSARDFARLGVMMLHHGVWDGKQIVSKDWMEQSTRASQKMNDHYGLQWWVDPEVKGYSAQGHLNTDLQIIPDLDLIIVRMQSKPFPGSREGAYRSEALKLFRRLVASPQS